MVNAGIIEKCLALLSNLPNRICSLVAELFRILTNSSVISKTSAAANIVEPLFNVLILRDLGTWGQHSALQALVNILEKPQNHSSLKLTLSQGIEPLTSFLQSPSQPIQQLSSELLAHLLARDHFQQDMTVKNLAVLLVQLAGIGILNLQRTTIKALEKISSIYPKAVADAGGIYELSKVLIQDEPEPTIEMMESAALVLCNVLRYNADYYFRVPQVVLVKILRSQHEETVTLTLNALNIQERTDASSAEHMAEAGAVDALLNLLRSHQSEEASVRLLEALFNNVKVREMKAAKYAIAPLSQYLLDPQTKSESARLLAALALSDLSQHEGLSRVNDSVAACQALVSLFENDGTEEIQMVAVCALQNYVMNSRSNRRAVVETGGILVIQELLLSPNSEIVIQAALLIKFLFLNLTLQEFASNELVRSLTGALEKEVSLNGTYNVEILKTINILFTNFPKDHVSEASTLCIPVLLSAIKSGSEPVQESALNTLVALKHSWPTMPVDVSKSQAMMAAEAIPILQQFLKTCSSALQDKAESLLHGLPGCLTARIKRASNLRQLMGGTNAFCLLMIGNGPVRQTKVIYHNTSPEWDEEFTWAFEIPPKGQQLQIQCKSRSTFGKTTMGRVTIQIDKVVCEGVHNGTFSISADSNREGLPRTLDIDITWSNTSSDDKEKETVESGSASQAENEAGTSSQAENEVDAPSQAVTPNQADNETNTPS